MNLKCGAIAVVGMALASGVMAQEIPKGAVMFTPANAKWVAGTVPGVENAAVIGAVGGAGRYELMAKFPPNFRVQPHSHPDERHYTIIKGTWYIGFGEKFDESKLIALPAGSYYTEPANLPHFVATKGEGAVVQIGGTGPSKQSWVNPADDPANKKK